MPEPQTATRTQRVVRSCVSVSAAFVLATTASVYIAPTVQAAPAAQPVLQLGSTGPAVQTLQTKLGVSPTGYFGEQTKKAVKKFQKAHGIPKTGVVAALTWAALGSARTPATAAPKAPAATAKRPTLRLGMTHPAVTVLQQKLKMPSATGYFGSQTDAYVRALQKAAKLKVTGVVNKKTWKKVGKVRFKAPGVAAAPAPAKAPAAGNVAQKIINIAASYQGVPYVANGYTPEQGFNCSSYTQWVFQQAGIDLGGAYTVWQYAKAKHITKAEARPGDLVFFYNYPDNFLGHVGIYTGNDMFWHAPRTGRVVSHDKLYTTKVLFARPIGL